VLDDSILDKNHFHNIDLVKKQYSGNAHGLTKGIALINCLHVNPGSSHYWVVDHRVSNPDGDGKTRLDHVHEMLSGAASNRHPAFNRVFFDSWHAMKKIYVVRLIIGKTVLLSAKKQPASR